MPRRGGAALAYVITQSCCKDASCVPVCPVDCIRPAGGDGASNDTEMLYIDPVACIDCGACLEECPVDAIYYEDDLPAELERFREINGSYFDRHPLQPLTPQPRQPRDPVPQAALRVAIVGSGPAACYAASELIRTEGVEVDMFERLPTPFGLIRSGVAPDHQHTKSVVDIFGATFSNARFGCHLNVEIGSAIHHDDLMAHHHAVIYAVGGSTSRMPGLPGEQLPGSHGAADFVGWYNGHPDHAGHTFDLRGERAVIVGNGNVALDNARLLLAPDDEIAATDIAEHALACLRQSNIREVVILGRRGPREAAFSAAEFLALGHLSDVDVVIEGGDLEPDPDDDVETALKVDVAREFAARPEKGNKRIVFRFLTSPVEVVGDGKVEGLRVQDATQTGAPSGGEHIAASLVLWSIGFAGAQVAGLPFDPTTGTVPNDEGRVLGPDQSPMPGVYVTGWIKRGSRGVIGTNRGCAEQTVAALWADYDAGLLHRDVADRSALRALLVDRGCEPIDWRGWLAIDSAERRRGKADSRPRVKFVHAADLVAAARSSDQS
jgi:ferredoxin--NADP+ reductase